MFFFRFFVILSVAFTISCTKKTGESSDTAYLKVRLKKEPVTLDWTKATGVPARKVIFNLMDPLVDLKVTENGVSVEPLLAESWKNDGEGKVWTINFRKDVKWSDGVPFQAHHVADAFERLLRPDTGAFNSFLFYSIKGAEEFNKGKVKTFDTVGIKVIDTHSLKFELKHAMFSFPKLLGLFNVLPVRNDLIKQHGEDKWWQGKRLVTLGPYVLDNVEHGQSYTLKANPNYWQKKFPKTDVEFVVVEEDATAIGLFESGDLHIVEGLPGEFVRKNEEREDYQRVQDLAVEYLGFNTNSPPFDDKLYRRALACAIDKESLLTVLSPGAQLVSQFLPDPLEGATSLDWNCPKENLDNPETPIKLTYYTDSEQKKIMEFVQQELRTKLEWSPELINQEWKVYIARVNSEPPQVYRLGWLAIFPDPILYLSLFTSDSHFNTSGWSNSSYDGLFKKIRSLPPSREREGLIQKANQILVADHQVVVPLFSGARHYLVSESVKGLVLNELNRLFLKNVRLK